MGLLSLIEKKCYPTIVIVDGTEDPQEQCKNLFIALSLAKNKFKCSFLPMQRTDGTDNDIDIDQDIRNFAENRDAIGFQFRCVYHKAHQAEIGKDAIGQSLIIYLKPRRKFVEDNQDQFDLPLNGCLTEWCHNKKLFSKIGGTFPHHPTFNQFFTSKQFDQYSKLGNLMAECYFQEEPSQLVVQESH